MGYLNIQHKTI